MADHDHLLLAEEEDSAECEDIQVESGSTSVEQEVEPENCGLRAKRSLIFRLGAVVVAIVFIARPGGGEKPVSAAEDTITEEWSVGSSGSHFLTSTVTTTSPNLGLALGLGVGVPLLAVGLGVGIGVGLNENKQWSTTTNQPSSDPPSWNPPLLNSNWNRWVVQPCVGSNHSCDTNEGGICLELISIGQPRTPLPAPLQSDTWYCLCGYGYECVAQCEDPKVPNVCAQQTTATSTTSTLATATITATATATWTTDTLTETTTMTGTLTQTISSTGTLTQTMISSTSTTSTETTLPLCHPASHGCDVSNGMCVVNGADWECVCMPGYICISGCSVPQDPKVCEETQTQTSSQTGTSTISTTGSSSLSSTATASLTSTASSTRTAVTTTTSSTQHNHNVCHVPGDLQVVFVVDESSSMMKQDVGPQKLQRSVAAEDFLQKLTMQFLQGNPTAQEAVVQFSTKNTRRRLSSATGEIGAFVEEPLSDDISDVCSHINIVPNGATYMWDGISLARDELNSAPASTEKHMIVLSDGIPHYTLDKENGWDICTRLGCLECCSECCESQKYCGYTGISGEPGKEPHSYPQPSDIACLAKRLSWHEAEKARMDGIQITTVGFGKLYDSDYSHATCQMCCVLDGVAGPAFSSGPDAAYNVDCEDAANWDSNVAACKIEDALCDTTSQCVPELLQGCPP